MANIIKLIKKNGWLSIIIFVYRNTLGIFVNYFSFEGMIYRRRIRNSQNLWHKLSGVVRYGPYKGLKVDRGYSWNKADIGGMLLGIYEKEVSSVLGLASKNYDNLIDIGAADGYYAIGCLVNNMFKQTYCYETSSANQKKIKERASINGVSDRIQIFGRACSNFYSTLVKSGVNLSKCAIICDIEGNEFNVFNKKTLKILRDTLIIIEIHSWHKNGVINYKRLKKNANSYFRISEIKTGARDLSRFPETVDFKDDDRWLFCSEGRHFLQTWLVLHPKNKKKLTTYTKEVLSKNKQV